MFIFYLNWVGLMDILRLVSFYQPFISLFVISHIYMYNCVCMCICICICTLRFGDLSGPTVSYSPPSHYSLGAPPTLRDPMEAVTVEVGRLV